MIATTFNFIACILFRALCILKRVRISFRLFFGFVFNVHMARDSLHR